MNKICCAVAEVERTQETKEVRKLKYESEIKIKKGSKQEGFINI